MTVPNSKIKLYIGLSYHRYDKIDLFTASELPDRPPNLSAAVSKMQLHEMSVTRLKVELEQVRHLSAFTVVYSLVLFVIIS